MIGMVTERDERDVPSVVGDDAEYERQVRSELALRRGRLVSIDEQLGKVQFQIAQLRPEKLLLKGDSRALAQGESFRRVLVERQAKLERERAEAQRDFEKAEERLDSLKEES